MRISTIITGTGSYTPPVVKYNGEFFHNGFYTSSGDPIPGMPADIIEKFEKMVRKGMIIVFALVGAGMNINAVCYRM